MDDITRKRQERAAAAQAAGAAEHARGQAWRLSLRDDLADGCGITDTGLVMCVTHPGEMVGVCMSPDAARALAEALIASAGHADLVRKEKPELEPPEGA